MMMMMMRKSFYSATYCLRAEKKFFVLLFIFEIRVHFDCAVHKCILIEMEPYLYMCG